MISFLREQLIPRSKFFVTEILQLQRLWLLLPGLPVRPKYKTVHSSAVYGLIELGRIYCCCCC